MNSHNKRLKNHLSSLLVYAISLSLSACQSVVAPPSLTTPVANSQTENKPTSVQEDHKLPARVTGFKEQAIAVGERLHIQGENFSPTDNYKVEVKTELGETKLTNSDNVAQDEIAVIIPWLDTAERSAKIQIQIIKNDQILHQASINLQKRTLNTAQNELLNEFESLKTRAQDQEAHQVPVDNLVEKIASLKQRGDVTQTNKDIDYVLASSIDSAASLELVLKTLETYQQKHGFKTAAQLFDSSEQLVLVNPIQRSILDPNMDKPNQLPACLNHQDTLDKDLVILYINGINTRSDQFCNTKQLITDMVNDLGISADVSGIYQHSLREDIENNPQKIEERRKACESLKNQTHNRIRIATAGGAVGTFNLPLTAGVAFEYADKQVDCSITPMAPMVADVAREAIRQRVADHKPAQVAELANIISRLLQKNKRIILMPHSQGNFFARQALERLLREAQKPGNIFTKEQIVNSVGVVWMASPVEIQRRQHTRITTGPGSIMVNPETALAAEKAAFALVCNSNLQEPTCHSTHVGIRQDIVAHLRYLDNWHFFLMIRTLNLNNVNIHPDYQDEYQASTFEAPIQIDSFEDLFEMRGADGGAAGIINLGFKAHDVDCSYLYDPDNPSEYCQSRNTEEHKKNKSDIRKSDFPSDPTPRKKIEEALVTISNNLQYPLGKPVIDSPVKIPEPTVVLDKVEDAAYPDNYGVSGKWKGRYTGPQSSTFDMYLTMDKNNQVLGIIMDDPLTGIGKAWVEGTFNNNRLTFVKRYFQGGTHSVNYSGLLSSSKTKIEGNWNIGGQSNGAWDADKQQSSGSSALIGKWEGVIIEPQGTKPKYPVIFDITELGENKVCGKWELSTIGCGGPLICQTAGNEPNSYIIDGIIEYGQSKCKEGSNRFILKGSDTVYRATFQSTSPDATLADGYLRRVY